MWAIFAGWQIAKKAGHNFNVHGDAIPVVAGIFFTGLIALIAECIAVFYAMRFLRWYPKRRQAWRMVLLAFGVSHIALIAGSPYVAMFIH